MKARAKVAAQSAKFWAKCEEKRLKLLKKWEARVAAQAAKLALREESKRLKLLKKAEARAAAQAEKLRIRQGGVAAPLGGVVGGVASKAVRVVDKIEDEGTI